MTTTATMETIPMKKLDKRCFRKCTLNFVFDYFKKNHRDIYNEFRKDGTYDKCDECIDEHLFFMFRSMLNDIIPKIYDESKPLMTDIFFKELKKRHKDVYKGLVKNGFYLVCKFQESKYFIFKADECSQDLGLGTILSNKT